MKYMLLVVMLLGVGCTSYPINPERDFSVFDKAKEEFAKLESLYKQASDYSARANQLINEGLESDLRVVIITCFESAKLMVIKAQNSLKEGLNLEIVKTDPELQGFLNKELSELEVKELRLEKAISIIK